MLEIDHLLVSGFGYILEQRFAIIKITKREGTNVSEIYAELTKEPIPLDAGEVGGWKEVPLIPSDEPVIPLGLFSEHSHILTDSNILRRAYEFSVCHGVA